VLNPKQMPEIVTRRFGSVPFDDREVLHFPSGLPGFEDKTRFLLVERAALKPIVVLQSLDTPELYLFATPVEAIDAEYRLAMTPEDQATLSLTADPRCLAIVSASKSGRWTANLLAPVVINQQTRRAVQAVRADSLYSHQHPLVNEDAPCS
jgi:flagellar assembly factor FliW